MTIAHSNQVSSLKNVMLKALYLGLALILTKVGWDISEVFFYLHQYYGGCSVLGTFWSAAIAFVCLCFKEREIKGISLKRISSVFFMIAALSFIAVIVFTLPNLMH